jgi:sterol desaturase/sphingolipid hydroxylase (fatty acid hydroxylase superfamily)
MYVFAAGRNHPLNVALTYAALTLPAMLLGADPQILALHSVFNALLGLAQHSNVDFRTGAIGWVLSTPELHRWHHSSDEAESKHNFGTDTAIWDWVFGTRHAPVHPSPARVGLPNLALPLNYLRHLGAPFALRRYQVRPSVTPSARLERSRPTTETTPQTAG